MKVCESVPSNFKHLYELDRPIKEEDRDHREQDLRRRRCDHTPLAERQIRRYTRLGFGNLPICMAKTHLSLSPIRTSRDAARVPVNVRR